MVAVGRVLNIAMSSRPIREGPSSPITEYWLVSCFSFLRSSIRAVKWSGEMIHADVQKEQNKSQTAGSVPALTQRHGVSGGQLPGQTRREKRGRTEKQLEVQKEQTFRKTGLEGKREKGELNSHNQNFLGCVFQGSCAHKLRN